MEEMIRKVLFTLDTIEVKGRKNIDRMLGCMQALEKVAAALAHNRETLAAAPADSAASGSPAPTNPPSEPKKGALTK